jgi:hypothetical protein
VDRGEQWALENYLIEEVSGTGKNFSLQRIAAVINATAPLAQVVDEIVRQSEASK